MGLLQGEHPEIFAEIGVGCAKSGFRRTKAVISLKRSRTKVTIEVEYEVIYALSIGAKNQRPWMNLKGHNALRFKTRASFGAHCENLNED